MPNKPLWTAVIPTYGEIGLALTSNLLRSLQHSTEKHEIVVVDDGSGPDVQMSVSDLCEEYGVRLLGLPRNRGFAYTVNRGIEMANGTVVILANNDTLQIGKTLDSLANFTLFAGAATVGCKLLYEDKTVQHGGICYVPPGYWDHIGRFMDRWAAPVCRIRHSLCTGAMLAISRSALDTVGLLDERYGMAVEDVDYQLRCIETGLRTFYCGIVEAYHLEGRTRGRTPAEKAKHDSWTEAERRGMAFFFERWKGLDFSQFQLGGPA